MTEKQFYDWQTLGGTDDVMRLANQFGTGLEWSIARDGDGFLLRAMSLENTLREKVHSWSNSERRQSERLKELADIARLVESHPDLWRSLPDDLQSKIDQPND
jgi:hypothetical protein